MQPFLKTFYAYRDFLNLSPQRLELLSKNIQFNPVFQQLAEVLQRLNLQYEYLGFLTTLKNCSEENLSDRLIEKINHPELIEFLNQQNWQNIFEQTKNDLEEAIAAKQQQIKGKESNIASNEAKIKEDAKIFQNPHIQPHYQVLTEKSFALKQLSLKTLEQLDIKPKLLSQKSEVQILHDHLNNWRTVDQYSSRFGQVCTDEIAKRNVAKPSLWKRFLNAMSGNRFYQKEVSDYNNAQKDIRTMLDIQQATKELNEFLPEDFYHDFKIQDKINHTVVQKDQLNSDLKGLQDINKTLNIKRTESETVKDNPSDTEEENDSERDSPKK